MWGLWLYPNILPDKTQDTQLSWLLSPAALPTGHWLRLPKLLKSGSSTSSNSSTLLQQQSSRQCCFLLWLNQTLTLLPTCAHWTLLLTSDKSLPWKFADLFTFCQKEQSTNNSQFWRNINPSLPNASRPLTWHQWLSEWLEPEHAGASWLSK